MTKSTIIFGVVGLVTGALMGYVVGYTSTKKKDKEDMDFLISQAKKEKEEKPEEKKEETVEDASKPDIKADELSLKASKIVSPGPAQIAMPGKPGVNYAAYSAKVEELKYKAESEHPTDSDEDPEEDVTTVNKDDFPQTYDERVQQDLMDISEEYDNYKKKRKKPFYILKDGVDPEWPDIHYDEEQLFYFTMDDVLTDEDGKFIDEKRFIGPDLRKFGWFINRNMTETTVRNMEYERDYKITKEFTSYDDFFPGKHIPDPDSDDDEEEEES